MSKLDLSEKLLLAVCIIFGSIDLVIILRNPNFWGL